MKLTCTQENFKKAISNCERVVSKQATLPILNNILFEAEKGSFRLAATNLEMGVTAKIGAKIEKEGRITIPAKLISSFSSNLPPRENVSLDILDQCLKIKSGSVKAVFKGISASDFPLIPKRNTEFLLNLPSAEFRNVIAKVMVCVGFNEARTELTGINLAMSRKELFFAATDSFRLAEHKISLNEEAVNREYFDAFLSKKDSVIVPASTLVELNRAISSNENEDGLVRIAIEEGQIFFETNGVQIVSRLINGKYPEYKHIMPKVYKTRIVGKKNALQGAVRMASVFSPGKANEITLKIDSQAKKIYTSAKSVDTGENLTELDFEATGPSQEVVFNAKYFLDGINSIATSKVAVLFNSESTPVGLQEIDEQTGEVLSDYTYIVMPIKN